MREETRRKEGESGNMKQERNRCATVGAIYGYPPREKRKGRRDSKRKQYWDGLILQSCPHMAAIQRLKQIKAERKK